MLNRRLVIIQWIALLLLMLGMVCTSLNGSHDSAQSEVSSWSIGVVIMIVIALCSSIAGVYNELLLKSSGLPVQVNNVYLYSYGVLTSGSVYACIRKPEQSFLDGFSSVVWAVVVTNGILGLVISFIFKYGDNIVKLFGSSSAVLVTAALAFSYSISILELNFGSVMH